ncbi:MAG: hypothetical protein QM802_21490 [Agriterribacter sp.]
MLEQEQSSKLSNLQLELLKIFSRNIPDEQLHEIKGILSRYFADKASDEFEKLAEQRGWTADTYRTCANEHNRSSRK